MKKNWLEWSVFAFGLTLVLGTIAYLGYAWATSGSQPPIIELELAAAERHGDQYLVPVAVVNRGDATAENVQVALWLEGLEDEQSDLQIAMIPRRSERNAWAVFSQDPAAHPIRYRVISYESP